MTESGALGGGADARLDQIAIVDDEDGGDALPLLEAVQNDVQSDYAADLPLIMRRRKMASMLPVRTQRRLGIASGIC